MVGRKMGTPGIQTTKDTEYTKNYDHPVLFLQTLFWVEDHYRPGID